MNNQALAPNSSSQVLNSCTNKVWVLDPFPQLEECANDQSEEGFNIYLKMKAKTDNNYPDLTSCKYTMMLVLFLKIENGLKIYFVNITLSLVPSITINNQLDVNAITNLLASACVNYKVNYNLYFFKY